MDKAIIVVSERPYFKLGFRPELNGLRGLAILIVLIGHFFDGIIPAQLGVVLFFALSGFLITSLLLEEWARTGGIAFKSFYYRRCLRLLPALMMFCLLAGALWAAGVPAFSSWSTDVWWVLGYMANYAIVWGKMSPNAPLGVCWSLAIEEHFYFLWPLTLFVLRKRHSPVGVAVWLMLGLALSEGWRWYVLLHSKTTIRLYFATDTRGSILLMGCLMACWWAHRGASTRPETTWLQDLTFFSILAFSIFYPLHMGLFVLAMPIYGLLMSIMVWGAVHWRTGWTGRFLRLPALCWLGKVSYGVYLYHAVILALIRPYGPAAWLSWLGLVVSLMLAAISFQFFESYFLKKKPTHPQAKVQPGVKSLVE